MVCWLILFLVFAIISLTSSLRLLYIIKLLSIQQRFYYSFHFHFCFPTTFTFIFQILTDLVKHLFFYLVFALLYLLSVLLLFPRDLLGQKCKLCTISFILFFHQNYISKHVLFFSFCYLWRNILNFTLILFMTFD